MDADILWHPALVRDLPASERIVPRPVLARRLRRLAGHDPGPVTDAERHDAIMILRDLYGIPSLAWLYAEAEHLFCTDGG